LSEAKYKNALDQLEEFKRVDCDNSELIGKLLTETRERQQSYLDSFEFQVGKQLAFTLEKSSFPVNK
jgi:hypothetical protein